MKLEEIILRHNNLNTIHTILEEYGIRNFNLDNYIRLAEKKYFYYNSNHIKSKKILDILINNRIVLTKQNLVNAIKLKIYDMAICLLEYVDIDDDIYDNINSETYMGGSMELKFLKELIKYVKPTKYDIIRLSKINYDFVCYCIEQLFEVDKELFDYFVNECDFKIIVCCLNKENVATELENYHIKKMIERKIPLKYLETILKQIIKNKIEIMNEDIIKMCDNKESYDVVIKILKPNLSLDERLLILCSYPSTVEIRKLIKEGAKPTIECLRKASVYNNNIGVIKELIKNGVTPDIICIKNQARVCRLANSLNYLIENYE